MPISSPPFPQYARPKISGTASFVLPSADASFQTVGTQTLSANTLRYCPFYLPYVVALNNFVIEIQTGATAGKLIRFGITAVDRDMQPLTNGMLFDSGSKAADTPAVITAASTLVLAPGWYCTLVVSDGAPVLRSFRGGQFAGVQTTIGVTPYVPSFSAAFTYGSFPATITAITTQASGGGNQFHHLVLLDVA